MNGPLQLHRRRGASLIEVAMSSLLVGVLLVAALNTVGARLRHQLLLSERHQAMLLAEQLTSEVLTCDYEDPDGAPVFGPEPSESGSGRELFDDVDDYHGWDAAPPEDRDGTPIANLSDWRRTIDVEYVEANDLTAASISDEGFKRITVEVFRNGKSLAKQVSLRSRAWEATP